MSIHNELQKFPTLSLQRIKRKSKRKKDERNDEKSVNNTLGSCQQMFQRFKY